MSQSSKTFAGSSLTPTGSAAVVGSDLRIAAVKSYDSDFSQYADGVAVTGWTTYTATFVKQTNAGTPVGRLAPTTGGWCGAWFAPGVGDGTWKVKAKAIGGRVNSAAQWNHTTGTGIGYQFIGTGISPGAYIPANFAGIYINGGSPATFVSTDEVSNTVHAHPVSGTKKIQVIRSTTAPNAYTAEFPSTWCSGTDFCLQGYVGTADVEYIRYWATRTGGFTATFTPLSVTSLTRIVIDWDSSASTKRALSQLFEYQLDGGAWTAVPNDGYVNAACTSTIGVRAASLKNDHDASVDLNVYSISLEIAGQWDAYIAPTVAAPTSLAAGTPTTTTLPLTWTDAASPAAFYDIYLATSSGGVYSLAGVATQGDEAFTLTGLTAGTAYYVKLKSRSAEGATSAFTAYVTATTASVAAPTGLAAGAPTSGSIPLTWTDAASPAAFYDVYMATSLLGTYSLVAVATQGDQALTVAGLSASTAYYFKLKARAVDGTLSAFTSAVTATTSAVAAPGAPTHLTVTSASSTAVALSWTAPAGLPAPTSYLVYRAEADGAGQWDAAAAIAVGSITGTTYTDNAANSSPDPVAGASYVYLVVGVADSLTSLPSNPVAASFVDATTRIAGDLESELDDFFADPFGEDIVYTRNGYGAVTIRGIFDDAAKDSAGQRGSIFNSDPQVTCKTSDVEHATNDDTVQIQGITFHVLNVDPDGTGFTILKLSKDAD